LIGAFVATRIAAARKLIFALVIGVVHLLGGIAAAYLIPAPMWFVTLDLTMAYMPVVWLAGSFALQGNR